MMPRYTVPSVEAPYVFRSGNDDGEIVQDFKYEVTLEEVDEILEEYDEGPFIAGESVTAADIFWAPFLERFAAHIPLLYPDIHPKGPESDSPFVTEWYDGMDQLVPAYSCRVKGRAETWRSVLIGAHPELRDGGGGGRKRTFPPPPPNLPTDKSFDATGVWSRYAEGRPYLAPTPGGGGRRQDREG